jgi:protein O-mannosyl-transferase
MAKRLHRATAVPVRHSRVRRSQPVWALGVGLIVAVLLVYAPALRLGFINFDDPQYVLENPHVRSGLTGDNVAWALTGTHAGNWHPVTWLSHMTDVELFDVDPRGHHATSVLIHLLNTLLLFVVLRRMTGQALRSAIVAALFGVHPLHVESVAWISERKDVLSTLFALLTLWAYVRYAERASWGRYVLVCSCLVLGLAAKPMLVTLPFVLLLLDIWPLERIKLEPVDGYHGAWISRLMRTREFRALVVEKIPLFLCAFVSSVVTYLVQQSAGAVRALDAIPLGRRVANALVAYVSYIGKMIWPVDLSPLYPYSPGEPSWRVGVAGVLLIALTISAIRAGSRYRYATVGWLWYLGTLLPVIGLVQVGSQPMADRYTYLPLVGLFIAIVWGLSDLAQRTPSLRYLFGAAGAAAIVASVEMARQQVALWDNSIDRWQHTLRLVRQNPNHERARQMLTDLRRLPSTLPAPGFER